MALSDARLRSLCGKPYSGKPELPDRDGLGVRISRNGVITWQYRFRWHQKAARLTLGRYPDLKVKQAREFLPTIRGLLSKGIDPRTGWNNDGDVKKTITAQDCVDLFIKVRLPNLKPKSQVQYTSVLNRYYRSLFPDRAIDEVPLTEWLIWFDQHSAANPKLSANLLKQGKTLFNWCSRRKMISPPEMMKLITEDVGIRPETGERVLTLRECASIWRALDQCRAAPSTTLCIKLCMLYGCRQGEIREAKREHFDMYTMIWTVPKELSKTNKPIRRPVTPVHEVLIRKLWSIYGEEGYLVPAEQNKTRPASAATLNKLIRAIRNRLQEEEVVIESWRCHDFRRTLSTRLSEEGIMPHVTEKMLGHVLTGVMSVYNKHDWLEDQRTAYNLWCRKILALCDERLQAMI